MSFEMLLRLGYIPAFFELANVTPSVSHEELPESVTKQGRVEINKGITKLQKGLAENFKESSYIPFKAVIDGILFAQHIWPRTESTILIEKLSTCKLLESLRTSCKEEADKWLFRFNKSFEESEQILILGKRHQPGKHNPELLKLVEDDKEDPRDVEFLNYSFKNCRTNE